MTKLEGEVLKGELSFSCKCNSKSLISNAKILFFKILL